ncbi:hypothetical protein BJ138DRAFT_1112079 [Hygrophoropsis aurantiaca]|uniref:Uncharacterized protein n=1 Tax=Hygrophoropsis aurantiaca TaxID=72124 RepID=A0ACB8AH60_9AGAM|nr:hypothetical protein BJ138DRAFT_1112079 [Hygrophoropsis aurantiaca]
MAISSPQRKRPSEIMLHILTLRRKFRKNAHVDVDDNLPPPPPPKDTVHYRSLSGPDTTPTPISTVAVENFGKHDTSHYAVVEVSIQPQYISSSLPQQTPPRVPAKRRVQGLPVPSLSPEEKAQRRRAAARQRELDEQAALREEQERQLLRKAEKEEQERRDRADEAHRKAVLEEQLRQAAIRKAREDEEARYEEENRVANLRARKQADKERRIQYTKDLERWRAEQIQRVESQESEKEESRRRSGEERRARIEKMTGEVFRDDGALCGWVTIQWPESVTWKRRYYKFEPDQGRVSLFRNPLEMTRALDVVGLDARVESINEWYEGFEELEAIPHSFALKFIDGQSWLLYADNAEDKDKLLVLLSEVAGVII